MLVEGVDDQIEDPADLGLEGLQGGAHGCFLTSRIGFIGLARM